MTKSPSPLRPKPLHVPVLGLRPPPPGTKWPGWVRAAVVIGGVEYSAWLLDHNSLKKGGRR